MYRGKVTNELKILYNQYYDTFGEEPETYDELEACEGWTYEEFYGVLTICLLENKKIIDVVK